MNRILVVEDNVDLAYGLHNNLEIEGYAVQVAHDGRAGLALALEQSFDLVILDLMMPGLDGLRVLKSLREQGDRTPPARFGNVVVDPASRTARLAGVEVPLSPKEFDLVWVLIEANGAAVSRDRLMECVWGYGADVLSRTVDTHIAELRRKLEPNASAPAHILTVRKIGYRLVRS